MRLAVRVAMVTAFAGAQPAHAGIVNVQSILATEAGDGLSGSFTGSMDWRTGNTELLLLSAAPVARFRAGDHLLVGVVRGEFGTSGDNRIIATTFEHLRYRYTISERLLGEVFAQHTYDQFKRLRLRALVGAGPKVDLVSRDDLRLSLGVAYMFEYQELRDDGAVDAGDTEVAHRASSYLTGSYELDDRVQLVATVYAQPRLTDPGDVRFLQESQVVVQLTTTLSLKTSFIMAYDSTPPAEIKQLDTALKTAISYEF